MKKMIMLIMDGFGYREEIQGNAIIEAKMENFNNLWNTYPHSVLEASGSFVGLPDNQFGNSEVCHTAIGVGKKIKQDLTIVNDAVKDKSIMKNEELFNLSSNLLIVNY